MNLSDSILFLSLLSWSFFVLNDGDDGDDRYGGDVSAKRVL